MIFKVKFIDLTLQEIITTHIDAESWNGCLLEFKKNFDINQLLEIKKVEY
jgi:hypothetical protein